MQELQEILCNILPASNTNGHGTFVAFDIARTLDLGLPVGSPVERRARPRRGRMHQNLMTVHLYN